MPRVPTPRIKALIPSLPKPTTVIPDFLAAIDAAASYLDPSIGILGVTDFYVSSKFDFPLRQLSWVRRFFWRSVFDTDNIDIGPERRHYLDHKLCRVWERNGEGTIPYVPAPLRCPFYVWLGRAPTLAAQLVEPKVGGCFGWVHVQGWRSRSEHGLALENILER